MHSPKTLALLLAPDLPVALQLRLAVRLATARQLDRLTLHRVEEGLQRIVPQIAREERAIDNTNLGEDR